MASGVHLGSELVLTRAEGDGGANFSVSDFARGTPIVVFAVAFVLVVGLVARWRDWPHC